jgi:hypothetical protein
MDLWRSQMKRFKLTIEADEQLFDSYFTATPGNVIHIISDALADLYSFREEPPALKVIDCEEV